MLYPSKSLLLKEKNFCTENHVGFHNVPVKNYDMALCVVWESRAYEKMKEKKKMFKKKAQDLYMRGEYKEMAALMDDHYAGKFKSSYDPELPWSKGKK